MKRLIALVILVAVSLGGCSTAGNVQRAYRPAPGDTISYVIIPKAEVSDEALAILRSELDGELRASGLLAAGPADARKAVEISITSYRMRHGATRAMVGIMAGSDNMQSSVVVTDKASGAVVGQFSVQSKNSTAWGTSRGMIADHAGKIVEYLRSGGS